MKVLLSLLFCSLALPFSFSAQAAIPRVTIKADLERTTEPLPNALLVLPGRFIVSRSGPVQEALKVNLTYSGTAANGVDYEKLPEEVTIPKGAVSANLLVVAKADDLVEGTEVVTARVRAPEPNTPPRYEAGSASASVEIADEDRPVDPARTIVGIVATRPETAEPSPTIRVVPGAFTLTRRGPLNNSLVVFLSAGGSATPVKDYESLPETVTFAPNRSTVVLEVMAIDDDVAEPTETVELRIVPSPEARPVPSYEIDPEHKAAVVRIHDSDQPAAATIHINHPEEGAVLPAGRDVEIGAVAVDPKGYIPRVEFYVDERLIGVSEIAFFRAPDPGTPIQHTVLWKNPPAGEHLLTARGVDAKGAAVVSAPVRVTVREGGSGQVTLAITATDAEAKEGSESNPAVFVIRRTGGPQNVAVVVSLEIGGTAKNGVDYQELPRTVTLPANREALEIVVRPIPDKALEGDESVTIALLPPVCIAIFPPPADCYLIDREHGSARAVILDSAPGPVNQRPRVTITAPSNGAVFAPGQAIEIKAEASDPDGTIRKLELRADGDLIKTVETGALRVVWSNAPAGPHKLDARAVDNKELAGEAQTVSILVRAAESWVRRDLPDGYTAGKSVAVQLRADPPNGTSGWAVEERPPRGWTVREISHEGVWDSATGKVKFGPFLDSKERTLTYAAVPPASATGRAEFEGSASADGKSSATGGERVIENVRATHPADANADFRITLDELTGYIEDWKEGPNNAYLMVPITFVTRAGLIWRSGEAYQFKSAAGPAPLCWVPLAGPDLAALSTPTAEREIQQFEVRIHAEPGAGARALAVQEELPAGWRAVGISDGGIFDAANRVVRWGPFFDGAAQTLSYTLAPVGGAWSQDLPLRGIVSADGAAREIAGELVFTGEPGAAPLRVPACERAADGSLRMRLQGAAGQVCTLEGSDDLRNWTELRQVFLPDGELELEENPAQGGTHRFYRLKAE